MKATLFFQRCATCLAHFLAPVIVSAGLSGCMTSRLVFNSVTCNEHTEEIGTFFPIKGAASPEKQSQACVDASIAATNIGANSPDGQLSYHPPRAAQNFLPIGLIMTMRAMRELSEGRNVDYNTAYLSYLGYFFKQQGLDPQALARFYDLYSRAEKGEYILPNGCGFMVDGRLPKEKEDSKNADPSKIPPIESIPSRTMCY